MEDIKDILDEEAAELFSKLHGMDYRYGKDRLSTSLEEEKNREDERRTLLVEIVHLRGVQARIGCFGEIKLEGDRGAITIVSGQRASRMVGILHHHIGLAEVVLKETKDQILK